jgi:superfamily II DNA or RNA helicase
MYKVLSNSGYKIKKNEYPCSDIAQIKKDLTVNPFSYGDFDKKDTKFSVYLESPSKLYVPRFYGLERFGEPTETRFSEPEPVKIRFKGSLRPEQEPIAQLYLDSAYKIGGGLISLKCGGGKTVLALYLASVLGLKTIVLVHKDFLMTQWRDRIIEFLPEAKIGKVQQNTVDIRGKDIVLAMVQSLSMKEYPEKTFASFGLAIFDECHHLGAEVFHRAMGKVTTRYSLGLSATPNRKDGLRKVFEWYIGPIVYMTKEKNKDYIEVRFHEYSHDSSEYNKLETLYNGKPCYPRMINNICGFQPRCQFILELVIKEHMLGRKILVLSDRRDYLNQTLESLNSYQNAVAGLYVGGMRPESLRESQEKDIILGTFSMASEGMDIPKLNTIVLASPKSDVVQSVGRILREKAEKRQFHPLIIDILDSHPNLKFFQGQSTKRRKFYQGQNYDIYDVVGDTKTKFVKAKRGRKPKVPVYDMGCLIED